MKYVVLSDKDDIVKELYRYIHVVDTQVTTYKLNNSTLVYYSGLSYLINDILLDYSDNYDPKNNLKVELEDDDFNTREEGTYPFGFSITDKSGNTVTYQTQIEVVLDFEVLIDEIYKNQTDKITKTTTGIESNYINVTIDSQTSFSYFDTGTIHFLKKFNTDLGINASIQISGYYGDLTSTTLNYHINGFGGKYSVGYITFD